MFLTGVERREVKCCRRSVGAELKVLVVLLLSDSTLGRVRSF